MSRHARVRPGKAKALQVDEARLRAHSYSRCKEARNRREDLQERANMPKGRIAFVFDGLCIHIYRRGPRVFVNKEFRACTLACIFARSGQRSFAGDLGKFASLSVT